MTISEYHEDKYPDYAKKCHKCGSYKIKRNIECWIDYRECEVSYRCSECGEYVAYWAYGHYDSMYDPNFTKSIDEKEKQLELKYKSNILEENYEEADLRINL